jgi:NAD(P)-dependent dehydrogenase (short-subunit alcohol dehydrogenase family)
MGSINEGARVVITGQDEGRVGEAVKQLGSEAIGIRADQTTLADLDRLVNQVKEQFDSLDILFLNAGVTMPAATLDVVQKFAPLMQEGGSIIANTTCLNQLGMPGMAVYSATKAGLRSLVRTWATEFLDRKIRVNAVAPGPINTPIYDKLGFSPEALQTMAAGVQAKVPLGRYGYSYRQLLPLLLSFPASYLEMCKLLPRNSEFI